MRRRGWSAVARATPRSEEHTSELQSPCNLVCRLLLETKKIVLGGLAPQNKSSRCNQALIKAILQGRHPFALTATRLSEYDLPRDWADQHFFFNDRATHEIYTLSLHDALPI